MKFLSNLRVFGKKPSELPEAASDMLSEISPASGTPFLKTVAWISAGAGALAFGLFVGRELRSRYKFNRRTPYDFYAHSGDPSDMEFGVGI